MKKHNLIFSTILCATLFLTACNETDDPESKEPLENGTSQNVESNEAEQNEQQKTDEQGLTEEQQSNNEQKDDSNSSTITYSTNGEEVTVETASVTSESQNYKMMVAKDFTLTAEEPGRDMLIYNQNDNLSMRIETFSTEDTNYEEFAKETENTIAITAPEGKYEQGDINEYVKSNSIKNAAVFIVKYEEDNEQVSTAIFEKDNIIVRLSVFDNLQSQLTNAFLQMGFTIQK